MKIAAISKKDRPREKLFRLGPNALSDYELLALILGSGTKEMGVLELAQQLLSSCGGCEGLLRVDSPASLTTKGIGKGKACALAAMAELCRRGGHYSEENLTEICQRLLRDCGDVESAYVIGLETRNKVVGTRLVGKGDEKRLVLSPSEILRSALAVGGRRFVFVHLHPSGVPFPSNYDVAMTSQLVADAKKVRLAVADHIILVREGRFSFKENHIL